MLATSVDMTWSAGGSVLSCVAWYVNGVSCDGCDGSAGRSWLKLCGLKEGKSPSSDAMIVNLRVQFTNSQAEQRTNRCSKPPCLPCADFRDEEVANVDTECSRVEPKKKQGRNLGSALLTISFQMPVEFATVDAAAGISLSLRIYRPENGRQERNLVLVLVHQFTVLGGCQGLLKGMATELMNRGYIVVTFDMRGAGRSSGKPTLTGSSEVEDVVAVCQWCSNHIPSAPRIVLVGSSAGAPIAGSAVDQVNEVVGYVGLGYPFGMLASVLFGRHYKTILQSGKPKLFVMGTKDGFTSVKQLESKIRTANGRAEVQLVPGVGHFQMEAPDYDATMAGMVTEFCTTL